MEIIQKLSPFIKYKLPQHESLKAKALNDIKNLGTFSIIESGQQLSNSDWYLPANKRRGYDEQLLPLFHEHKDRIQRELKIPFSLSINSYWFQQYAKGDFHEWHTHDCVLANVYYLDLPDGTSKTSFKHFDEEFEIEVEEGDILTFPGSYIHRSKPNLSDNVKTVISFNIVARR